MPHAGADDRAASVGGSGRRAPVVRPPGIRAVMACAAAAALVAGCASAERPAPTAAPAEAPTPTRTPGMPGTQGTPAGTGGAGEATRDPERSDPGSAAPPAPGRAPGKAAAPAPGPVPRARTPLVVLDPGHDGRNAAHPEVTDRPVEAGHGRTKPCNTIGTSTAAGYQEHAFTWDVAVRARTLLARRGVKVVLTRPDDRGVGPCVNVRGRFGNTLQADAVVSVHADGAGPAGSGFHVIEAARPPAGPAVARSSHRLALAVRAALRSRSGLRYASYAAGGDGLDTRDDLAGLNLSTRPSVVVECGNMRNPGDAAVLSAAAGRQRIAAALAAGVLAYLSGR